MPINTKNYCSKHLIKKNTKNCANKTIVCTSHNNSPRELNIYLKKLCFSVFFFCVRNIHTQHFIIILTFILYSHTQKKCVLYGNVKDIKVKLLFAFFHARHTYNKNTDFIEGNCYMLYILPLNYSLLYIVIVLFKCV